MTEIEAALLADRLRRVWQLRDDRWLINHFSNFSFFGSIIGLHNAHFSVIQHPSNKQFEYELSLEDAVSVKIVFLYFEEWSKTINKELRSDSILATRFADKILPLFRRSCYLSGASIEATATEKMHWLTEARASGMLTDEEVEALLAPQEAMV